MHLNEKRLRLGSREFNGIHISTQNDKKTLKLFISLSK